MVLGEGGGCAWGAMQTTEHESGVSRVVSSRSRSAAPADLEVVALWIASQRECAPWAGPAVPFPLELSALPEQIGSGLRRRRDTRP
jgi:hypothetical protein